MSLFLCVPCLLHLGYTYLELLAVITVVNEWPDAGIPLTLSCLLEKQTESLPLVSSKYTLLPKQINSLGNASQHIGTVKAESSIAVLSPVAGGDTHGTGKGTEVGGCPHPWSLVTSS